MSLKPVMKRRTYEYVVGVGVTVDGVLDASSLNGPWTLPIPALTAEIEVDGCGAGGAGAAGNAGTTATTNGGGSGAGSGMCVRGLRVPVNPGSTLTVTLGIGGVPLTTASNAFQGSIPGGALTISGVPARAGGLPLMTSAGVLSIHGGTGGTKATTGGGGNAGNGGGASSLLANGYGVAYGGNAGSYGSSPGVSTIGVEFNAVHAVIGSFVYAHGGVGSGSSSSVGSTAGGSSATWRGQNRGTSINQIFQQAFPGYTDGTNSYGAGGAGGPSLYGYPGDPGTGTVLNATDGTGYGYGGSGGRGGGGLGAKGGDAYCRISFWEIVEQENVSTTELRTEVAAELLARGVTSAVMARLDEAISSRLAAAAYTAGGGLDAAGVRTALGLAAANLDTQLDALPTNAELTAALAAADDATLAAISALPAPLTAAGVRTALGLAAANLDTQLDALPTNAELTAALAAADDATLAAINALPAPLTAAGVRTALGLAAANLDTQLDALPTSAELSAALAAADDATLTAISNLPVPLTAEAVRTALGLASPNLDSQFDALPTADEIGDDIAARTLLADVRRVNNIPIEGGGVEETDEWRPAT